MLCLWILVSQTQSGESELWLRSRFSWVVEKMQATVTSIWDGPRAAAREAGLFSVFHPHLLRFAPQGLVVTACSISSKGIGTMLVFVKRSAQKLLVLNRTVSTSPGAKFLQVFV